MYCRDVPFNHTMPIPQHSKDYIVDQFKEAIAQLEEICGRPFDYDKFFKVQEQDAALRCRMEPGCRLCPEQTVTIKRI